MTKKIFTGIAIILIAGFVCLCGWLILGEGSAYYAQVDNSKMEQPGGTEGVINLNGNGGLRYSYTLPAFDEKGRARELTFGASKELKEGAFIRLKVMSFRGVLEWSEVQYDELPDAVRALYPA